MALTRKQKNQVILHRNLTAKEISSKLDLNKKDVENFLLSLKSKSSSKKTAPKWFYIIPILIPVIFFILLEIALRIFSYGADITQWVKITPDKYILNPEVARRYFYTTTNVPYAIQNSFDVEKKVNAFRVFILGESSAAGYPFAPNGDFGRYIRKRLEAAYPSSKIEMINLGITAVNSYTLRDLFPGVLEQQPDLILIYTGHNEYYGALGVGSMESLGSSPSVVNTALYLNRFKIFQLIRNIIKSVMGLFSSDSSGDSGGTLMARMAKDKLIKLNSDVYFEGLNQYESNMTDVLEMAKETGTPVMLGTVTFNLKDQPPFISTPTEGLPEANEIFEQAQSSLEKGNIEEADSLFRFAKDLDALKFRAPEALNIITHKLGSRYGYPVVDVDAEFSNYSPDKIVGSNLMVDHLHPTLSGYQLLGKLFYKGMEEVNYLPGSQKDSLSESAADSAAMMNFYFSKLDSTIADFRIIILKNDWPFSERKSLQNMLKEFNLQTKLDTIALKVVDNKLTWEAAHREVSAIYFNNRDYDKYTYEMNVLIDQYPFILEYYDDAAENLLQVKQYEHAREILWKRYNYSPSAFSSKWLGILELNNNKIIEAINYLKESAEYDNNDPQVLYNLAGAYSLNKEFQKALDAVNRCISLDPNFPQAQGLKQQLISILNN